MKKIFTVLSYILVLTSLQIFANIEAENSSKAANSKAKHPQYALIMKTNKDGTRSLLKIPANTKWNDIEFKDAVKKLNNNSQKFEVATIKIPASKNDEANKSGGIQSWCYYGYGHNYYYAPVYYGYYNNCGNYNYSCNWNYGWQSSGYYGYGYYYQNWYTYNYNSATYWYFY